MKKDLPIIEKFLLNFLETNLACPAEIMKKSSNIFDDGVDSFGFIQMVTAIEAEFKVNFEENELLSEEMLQISEMAKLIYKKQV